MYIGIGKQKGFDTMSKSKKFLVTKKFISGILKGKTLKENTNVKFVMGKAYHSIGSGYIVTAIEVLV